MQSEPSPGMPRVPGRRLPRALLTPAVLVAVAAVSLSVGAVVVTSLADAWGTGPAAQLLVDATVGASCPLVGALMIVAGRIGAGARQLAHVLLTAGLASAGAAMTTALGLSATEVTDTARLWSQLQSFLWVPGFLPLLTLVPLLYPEGLLPGRLWRGTALASVVGTGLFTLGVAFFDESLAGQVDVPKLVTAPGLAEPLAFLGALLLLPSAALAVSSLVVRLRRSHGLARRQVVVLLVAAALLALVTAVQGLVPSPTDVLLQALAVALVPLSVGTAVTRHRLYDLDLAVCRALVVVSLGVCLVGAYLSVFALIEGITGGRSALSTGLAAGVSGAVLQPLGRRLAVGVDRLYFGDRADPFVVTSRLGARLTSTGAGVADVPEIVCDQIVTDLRVRGARVVVGTGDEARVAATRGVLEPSGVQRFGLRHRGEVVGHLEVSPRLGERRFDGRDLRVLAAVADQVAPAVAALELHQALQRSRESLVAAREAERRRLRRELHDGLGASLAGLRLQLETARDLSRDDRVVRLLTSAGSGVAEAVAEVRTLCDGLRPPGIDDLGLSRALVALADRVEHPGLRVDVDVDEALQLDPAIEVALYRIAAEALANVARHSRAEVAALQVRAGRAVELVVEDNGVGVHTASERAGSGVGLASIHQRAEEVGGRLTVRIRDLGGTEVRAVLPLTMGGTT